MDSKFLKKTDGSYTISITNGDLTEEDGFDTAINISLLTDARATEEQVNQPEFRRGWLPDIVSPVEGRKLGSWLWTVDQSKLIPDTLNKDINFSQLALNWFVEDNIAKSIIVTGEIIPRTGIQITIVIVALDGTTTTHYRNLWEMTGNAA